jgi:hypothetical protein
MSKYTVTWEMPYQGKGVETKRIEHFERAEAAYRQLVSVQCDPECTKGRAMTYDGRPVTSRQLRAWAKIK